MEMDGDPTNSGQRFTADKPNVLGNSGKLKANDGLLNIWTTPMALGLKLALQKLQKTRYLPTEIPVGIMLLPMAH